MAQPTPPRVRDPNEGRKAVFLVLGILGLVGGTGLLLYGLAPAEGILAFFGDFRTVQPEKAQAMVDELGARVWWDAAGSAFLVAGTVLTKLALRKPKPKGLEQRIQEAVEARLAASWGPASAPAAAPGPAPASAPAPAPAARLDPRKPVPVPVDVPPPAPKAPPAPPAGPRCRKCGRLLVAGGKLCRQCDMA